MDRIIGYKEYVSQAGDTFDALALAMYNDEKLAHRIIQFNPDYADTVVFDSGVALRLPIYDEDTSSSSESTPPWRRDE